MPGSVSMNVASQGIEFHWASTDFVMERGECCRCEQLLLKISDIWGIGWFECLTFPTRKHPMYRTVARWQFSRCSWLLQFHAKSLRNAHWLIG